MSITTINAPLGKPGRHAWGDPVRFQYKTERICLVCGLIKVTRHEPSTHPWLEFWRGSEKLDVQCTPVCQ